MSDNPEPIPPKVQPTPSGRFFRYSKTGEPDVWTDREGGYPAEDGWQVEETDRFPEKYERRQDGAWVVDSDARDADLRASIDVERDRRIDAGMTVGGVRYQTRPQDRENLNGAATLALAAIVQGAAAGDLYWHGGAAPFAWIAEDNSLHQFDAPGLFALGEAMATHKSALIFAARALKSADPIPANFTDDLHWPT